MAIPAPVHGPGAIIALPRDGGLSRRRRAGGFAVVLVGLPLLTWLLVLLRDVLARESALLTYLIAVVVVAVVGGLPPALLAAGLAFLFANWFLTPPYNTFEVREQSAFLDLVVFVVAAVTVSVTVDLGARYRARAERNRLEARLLSRLSADTSSESVQQVLEQVRVLFGLEAVALAPVGAAEAPLASIGPPPHGDPTLRIAAGGGLELTAYGPELFAEDRRLLGELAATAARAWDRQRLAREAERAAQLAETDRVRSALLAAVSHDLRTPLAGIKAAASGLRDDSVGWSPEEEHELLAAIEDSADRLSSLVENQLAMSRIQAGAGSVQPAPVALDEAVSRALLGTPGHAVVVAVAEDLPLVRADAALLERVVANLVDNARRFSPHGVAVEVYAGVHGSAVELAVRDHGPGVPPDRWEEMFVPFQRLGDSAQGGVGLGLAIARGLCSAMGASLVPSATPGGGLTMTVTLPLEAP
jgi:K+-sensing histidine kinase KdpD